MGRTADHRRKNLNLARAAGQNLSDIAAGIENHGFLALDHGVIHVLGAVHSAFLADGKQDFRIAARKVLFLNNAHSLDDGCDSGFVVAA